nr:MAG TPA: hypothetical protein [Caudoviricetes sp.]
MVENTGFTRGTSHKKESGDVGSNPAYQLKNCSSGLISWMQYGD